MRVAVADDMALFRQGLVALLRAADIEVTAACATGDELVLAVAADPPDVAIVDLRMPPTKSSEGVVAAELIRAAHPGVAVLVLSGFLDPAHASRLLANGATGVGYLLKSRVDDVKTLLRALDRLLNGEAVIDPEVVETLLVRSSGLSSLTPREREVLGLMAEGRSNPGISRTLNVSLATVEERATRIFAKLDLSESDDNRRVQAVLAYLRSSQHM